MTARQLSELIGRHATYQLPRSDLCLHVTILDARQRFGRIDALIRPLDPDSSGSTWVELHKLNLEDQPEA